MAKRLLVVVVVLAVGVLSGCGSQATGAKFDPRIVSNNSASFEAEARKALKFGELDVEAIIRTAKPGTLVRTPDRPIGGEPIRPKPQGGGAAAPASSGPGEDPSTALEAAYPDAGDVEAASAEGRDWREKLDVVAEKFPHLADQVDVLKATAKADRKAVQAAFKSEVSALDVDAAYQKQTAWRKATPASRLQQFREKVAAVS
ncbi:MAG: hypothetical protein FJZ00_13385, partial [Candidatus Sericytochromatia bacterium]|nr:hypothetical protein [Candidatus Tanganyikabacteria bacterium]